LSLPPVPLSFADALTTEAIRRIESDGPLEDQSVLRQLAHAPEPAPWPLVQRARLLAERLGLPGRLARARDLAPLVLLGLAALMVAAGLGLAGAVVDAQERRINVIASLAGLLGLHGLSLLAWLAALLVPGQGRGGALAGRLWLALTARTALGRGREGGALLQAGVQLLERARLLPWLLGLASHLLWAIGFGVAIAALLSALAFRRYTLGWETTLLDPAGFARAIDAMAWLPGLLGFPVPDATLIRAAGDPAAPPDAAGQAVLAWWLVGCVLVYGLVPRLLCALWCTALWQARRRRLQPDFTLPYYRQLQARLDALAPARVVDAELVAGHGAALPRRAHDAPGAPVLLAFELPPEQPWPPADLPHDVRAWACDGSAAARAAAVQQVAAWRPRRLVVACQATASPDRGTERLLRELLPLAASLHLWLVDADQADEAQRARWPRWLHDTSLDALVACHPRWQSALADLAPGAATPEAPR